MRIRIINRSCIIIIIIRSCNRRHTRRKSIRLLTDLRFTTNEFKILFDFHYILLLFLQEIQLVNLDKNRVNLIEILRFQVRDAVRFLEMQHHRLVQHSKRFFETFRFLKQHALIQWDNNILIRRINRLRKFKHRLRFIFQPWNMFLLFTRHIHNRLILLPKRWQCLRGIRNIINNSSFILIFFSLRCSHVN